MRDGCSQTVVIADSVGTERSVAHGPATPWSSLPPRRTPRRQRPRRRRSPPTGAASNSRLSSRWLARRRVGSYRRCRPDPIGWHRLHPQEELVEEIALQALHLHELVGDAVEEDPVGLQGGPGADGGGGEDGLRLGVDLRGDALGVALAPLALIAVRQGFDDVGPQA